MALGSGVQTAADYGLVLDEYLRTRSEQALLMVSDLSRIFVENGLGPEDVVALHFASLERVLPRLSTRERARAVGDAHQFLLETMITYGVRYREYLELRLAQAVRDADARATREREHILEAQRVEQESRDILAMIAHELRTPLTAATVSLDLAHRLLTQGRVDSATRHVGIARDAIDRLSRLSADLVEASRGSLPALQLAPTSLLPIVEQAVSWARPTAASKRISLTVEAPPSPIVVLGDADALLSIFGNLLSNAIRYTTAGGVVLVRLGQTDQVASGEVVDTGIGMAPEVVGRIFDRFYRAAEAQRVEAQGLGLGLSLVRQLIQAQNGRVEVQSAPGQGSTFRILLPLAAPDTKID